MASQAGTEARPSAVTAVRSAPGVEIAPPVTPNLVKTPEVAAAPKVGKSTIETLLFRGLSTPIAMVLVVLQSRFLHPEGRGAFVLAVLSVTIFSRLLGQLGVAVTNRRQEHPDLRGLVLRAFAIAVVAGAVGAALIAVWARLRTASVFGWARSPPARSSRT